MNITNDCRIKEGTQQQTDLFTAQFIRTVLEQQRHAKELHQQEIQSTAENPRIREQNETTAISAELKALRHDEFVSEKRRQQLRQNNQELRQLEQQLRTAIAAKKLADQLHTVEDNKRERELQKRKESEEAEKLRLQNLELQYKEEEQERLKRSQLRANLLEQINGMKEKQKQEYAQVMREREDMQQMLKRFDEERENERKQEERRKQETYDMMQTFLKETAEYKEKMKAQNRSDDSLMLKLLEERERDRERLIDERRKQWAKHAELSKRIGVGVFQIMEEKRKRENLLLDLLVQERNANEEMRARSELEKREEQRMQMRSELERYLGEVKAYKVQMKKQDEAYWNSQRKDIESKLERDDRLKEEERIKRNLEYQKGILQLIEERRLLRAMTAAEERSLYQQLLKEQMEQDEEVQKERLRLLKSCSPDVLRYLPAGVLKDTDKQYLAKPHENNCNN